MSDNDWPKIGINTQELVDAVNALIKKAYWHHCHNKEDFGSVNWGDIGVAEVEYRRAVYPAGEPYTAVLIEEASDDCKLPQWIAKRLEGFPGRIEIVCEW